MAGNERAAENFIRRARRAIDNTASAETTWPDSGSPVFAYHAMVNREKALIVLPQTPPAGLITLFVRWNKLARHACFRVVVNKLIRQWLATFPVSLARALAVLESRRAG